MVSDGDAEGKRAQKPVPPQHEAGAWRSDGIRDAIRAANYPDAAEQHIRALESQLSAERKARQAAERERDEAREVLAGATDVANSWARELGGATESTDERGLRDLVDRLWGVTSSRYFGLRSQLAECRKDTERLDWLALNCHPNAESMGQPLTYFACIEWEEHQTMRQAIDTAICTQKEGR